MKPSTLYRGDLWKLGMKIAGILPPQFLRIVARNSAAAYATINQKRCDIVRQNLAPLFENEAALNRNAQLLFRNFGEKLVDLWNYENGAGPETIRFDENSWGNFQSARTHGRGVLLLTPHLGNWELGGLILKSRNTPLHVITLPEPQDQFTAMRQRARERFGIKTIVIAENPFAFIEVIRVLEQGGTVALLVDRPAPQSSVLVEFCKRPFPVSIAPAELARATGCALLPAYIVHENGAYTARIMPELRCDRRHLGTRADRAKLSQEMISLFEQPIKQYANQWYHFVPVWSESPQHF
ncbi:MAG: lysophospholipid acyltransferase family protein [Verrucomicrobiota bacterium]|nr:lysophospholipid acyltransferase family protein [Verrucomicrobiota bacterium]